MKSDFLTVLLAGLLYCNAGNTQTYNATSVPVSIPDGGSTTCWNSPGSAASATINVPLSNTILDVSKVTISIALSHTYAGDIRLQLIPPEGAPVINLIDRLGNDLCGSARDFSASNLLSFNSLASSPIAASANPIPAGTYLPGAGTNGSAGNLGDLLGVAVNGNWTISIVDGTVADIGQLSSASITFAAGALPVELVDFQAIPKGTFIQLEWETAAEGNNAGYEILRSREGLQWEKIGWIAGNGTSQTSHRYRFADRTPLKGENYYRLRQLDTDGSGHLSPVRVVKVGAEEAGFQAFPLPVRGDELHLNIPLEGGVALLTLSDGNGKSLITQTWGYGQGTLDLREIPNGIYILHVENGRNRYVERITVSRP
jgi:subtilisin-like proprotein convertase family protein